MFAPRQDAEASMGMRTTLRAAAGCVSILAYAAGASADDATASGGRLPVAFVERGLTLPKMILAPEVDFGVGRLGGGTIVNLTALGQFSITDDLTVRATVVPLQLSPTLYYGNVDNPGPTVGATYRFLRGDVEVGVSADLGITAYEATGFYFDPGLPVHIHFGSRVRLDTGAFLPVQTIPGARTGLGPAPGNTTLFEVNVPVRVAVQILEPVHVGAMTGFRAAFNPPAGNFGDTIGIPLGVFAGYAIAGAKGPIVDIDPFFSWFQFLSGTPRNTVDASDFEVGVAVTGYLYL
jgi:hypothetical protein